MRFRFLSRSAKKNIAISEEPINHPEPQNSKLLHFLKRGNVAQLTLPCEPEPSIQVFITCPAYCCLLSTSCKL